MQLIGKFDSYSNNPRGRPMATNKQIYEELIVLNKDKNGSISSISKTIRSISYYQNTMKRDVKEISKACNDRGYGCGNNK